MLEMNKEWDALQDSLLKLDKEERDHFARMVITLAKAFAPASTTRVLMLMENTKTFALLCANASDMDAAQMLSVAKDHMNFVVNVDRPADGRLN